jgi:hypothetical protein
MIHDHYNVTIVTFTTNFAATTAPATTTSATVTNEIRIKTRVETIESPPRLYHPRHTLLMPTSRAITNYLYAVDLPLLDYDDSMIILGSQQSLQ